MNDISRNFSERFQFPHRKRFFSVSGIFRQHFKSICEAGKNYYSLRGTLEYQKQCVLEAIRIHYGYINQLVTFLMNIDSTVDRSKNPWLVPLIRLIFGLIIERYGWLILSRLLEKFILEQCRKTERNYGNLRDDFVILCFLYSFSITSVECLRIRNYRTIFK